jgi:hypothetical protein
MPQTCSNRCLSSKSERPTTCRKSLRVLAVEVVKAGFEPATSRYDNNAIKVYQPFSEENGRDTLVALSCRKVCCGCWLRRMRSFSLRCHARSFSVCEPDSARSVSTGPIDFCGRLRVVETKEVL